MDSRINLNLKHETSRERAHSALLYLMTQQSHQHNSKTPLSRRCLKLDQGLVGNCLLTVHLIQQDSAQYYF